MNLMTSKKRHAVPHRAVVVALLISALSVPALMWRFVVSRQNNALAVLKSRDGIWWDSGVTYFGPDRIWFDGVLEPAPKFLHDYFSTTQCHHIFMIGPGVDDSDVHYLSQLSPVVNQLTIIGTSISCDGFSELDDSFRHVEIIDHSLNKLALEHLAASKRMVSLSVVGEATPEEHLSIFSSSEIQHVTLNVEGKLDLEKEVSKQMNKCLIHILPRGRRIEVLQDYAGGYRKLLENGALQKN